MSVTASNGIDTQAAAARVAQSLAASRAAAASTSTQSTVSSTSSQGISSSDFLTLLVTEMKNQDPTQPTDPNAYIQQLVGVNSLQQLIAINQDLTGVSSASTSSSGNALQVTGAS